MNINPYIGNGAYCYANSTAMLLASIGEDVSPSIVETLCGIGLSAFWHEEENLLFFNFALPSEELTRAVEILGFRWKERVVSKREDPPLEQLKTDLEKSPVLFGPVDMGYLDYNPNHKFLYSADHYVLLYNYKEGNYHLHDPEKFPCVLVTEDQLVKSWNSDKIYYGTENYQYWTMPKRVSKPAESEIYDKAMMDFKSIYANCDKKSEKNNWITGSDAVLKAAKRFKREAVEQGEIDHFRYFALPLGAKRALDFAKFFEKNDPKLSDLKIKQAKLFGKCQSLAMREEWRRVGDALEEYAEVENRVRNVIMNPEIGI